MPGYSRKLDHVLDKVNVIYDKNFDKFEMYSLRNIFRIPDDLGDKTKVGVVVDGVTADTDSASAVFTEADEKRVDDRRYQLLHQIVSLRRENKRSARKLCSPYTCLFFCLKKHSDQYPISKNKECVHSIVSILRTFTVGCQC